MIQAICADALLRRAALGCLALVTLVTLSAGCEPEVAIRDTALVSDTLDGRGPFEVTTVIEGGARASGVVLYHRAAGGAWRQTPMRATRSAEGRMRAAIDPLALDGAPWPLGTRVEYYVEVTRDDGQALRDPTDAPATAYAFVIGAPGDAVRLTELTPRAGPSAGGTPVFLRGAGFRPDAEVRFGPARATHVEVVSPSFIRARTPPGVPGLVDVTIVDDLGHVATLQDAFFYIAPPTPLVVEPSSGPTAGGTSVVVRGRDFEPGATLTFGGAPALDVVFVDAQTLEARTPPGLPGPVNVTVTNPDGQSGTLVDGFEYIPPPEVAGVEPPVGPATGGTTVRVVGQGFAPGATVTFDGEVLDCEWLDAQTLRCTTPPHAAGPVDVTVTNPDGQSDTRADGFTYLDPPIVDDVLPGEGSMAGGDEVIVRGENFYPGATVTFGGVEADCEVLTESTIFCVTPPGAEGPVDVTVTNPDGQSDALADGFTYLFPPPEVVDVQPPRGSDLGGTRVVITVRWLRPGARVDFDLGACLIASVTVDPQTFVGQVVCTTPPHPEGLSDVTVTNPDGQSGARQDGFDFVGPPRIFEISPAQGHDVGGTTVTITGENFVPGSVVRFDGLVAQVLSISPDGTTLILRTPPHPRGFVDVSVTNPDGRSDAAPDGFEYIWPPPEIIALDPDEGPTWGGGLVAIIGRGFRPGAQVLLDGAPLPAGLVRFVGPERVELLAMPPGAPGVVTLRVVNTDSQSSGPALYTYRPIEISPPGGLTAGFTTVTARGFDFSPGAAVTVGGAPARSVEVIDPSTLVFVTPPGALGPRDVRVTLPDGRAELLPAAFTYRRLVERTAAANLAPSLDCQKNALVDLDGDGDLDLLTGNGGFGIDGDVGVANTVQRNQGGAFGPVSFIQPADRTLNFTLGDVDGDGDTDVVSINLGDVTRLYRNDGAATLTNAVGALPLNLVSVYDAKLADLDRDGDLDLVGFQLNEFEQELLFINDGNGAFTDRSFRLPDDTVPQQHDHDVVVGDVNRDGWLDLFVAVDNTFQGPFNGDRFDGRSRLYLSDQAGGYVIDASQPFSSTQGDALDADLVDIDNDGDLDLLIPDNIIWINGASVDPLVVPPNFNRSSLLIYLNDGSGDFTLARDRAPALLVDAFNVTPVDLDADGDLDVIVSTASDTTQPDEPFVDKFSNVLLVNDGDGFLFDAGQSWTSVAEASINIAAGRVDADPWPDLVICNYGTPDRLYIQSGQ